MLCHVSSIQSFGRDGPEAVVRDKRTHGKRVALHGAAGEARKRSSC
jgi:hypothetical protein